MVTPDNGVIGVPVSTDYNEEVPLPRGDPSVLGCRS